MKKANISFTDALIIILVLLSIAIFGTLGLKILMTPPRTSLIGKDVSAEQHERLGRDKIGYKKYYPLRQGDSWTYSVIEGEDMHEETVRVEGKEIINGVETVKMMDDDNDYDCIAVDSEGVKQYKEFDDDEYYIFNPPRLVFPNIGIGKDKRYLTDKILYSIEGSKTEEESENGKIMLKSIEDIEVPAGKFNDCLKFLVISEWKDSSGSYGKDECTIWLASGVGKVMEQCTEVEYSPDGDVDTETSISKLISYNVK